MNRLRLISALLLCTYFAQAQQLSLFTQYRENIDIVNPAALPTEYLAYDQNMSFGATYRKQWTDFPGAPTTQTIRGTFFYKERSSFNFLTGGHLINDQTGPTGFTGIYGKFGGIISKDPYYGGIGLALNAGAVQYRVNASEINLRDAGDILGETDQNVWSPDVGFGIFAYTRFGGSRWNQGSILSGGVSVPQVLGLNLTFRGEDGEFSTQRVQHVYGHIDFIKFFRDGKFIEPSVWVKYAPNAPVNVDVNLRYQMATNFWIGAGSSLSGNLHLETGFLLGDVEYGNAFKIGYGFDYSFSTFGPDAGGTHEINLSYSFDY
ncbi:MAG: PorP/SprF family type IX secretion system membrane protein [Saprospiraceae bacterium]|nr:PorP/SprF family type IX secretion system membrane protein [Saprospiraceae bacterium]